MQILKNDVKKKIDESALKVFYHKGYPKATMKEIAQEAGISTSLIYLYHKNKEALFDSLVQVVYRIFEASIHAEDVTEGSPMEKMSQAGEHYLLELCKKHRHFVVLMDKSDGSGHEGAKALLIARLEEHIRSNLRLWATKDCDDLLPHILATNFTEGLLEIARHYKSYAWAKETLQLLVTCYFYGVQSLME